jgi:NhaA family Na+:H+ antiporter
MASSEPAAEKGGASSAPHRLIRPLLQFASIPSAGGILLLLCTVVALLWANSPWSDTYNRILETKISIGVPGAAVSETVLHWINDGLMAIFFFVIGLEIKREVLTGELSSFRKASLPLMAALGGMLIPALCYLLLNFGGEGASGWGVPMATDIAFTLGVLALLGDRVPAALKVFLVAFAIADDVGAILIIAFFYSTGINFGALAIGLGLLGLAALANRAGVRRVSVYLLIGAECGLHSSSRESTPPSRGFFWR